jgi:hypothetical protein
MDDAYCFSLAQENVEFIIKLWFIITEHLLILINYLIRLLFWTNRDALSHSAQSKEMSPTSTVYNVIPFLT